MENIIELYTKKAKEVFVKFKIDGEMSNVGIEKNVEIWWKQKQRLIEMFRKHPYWNESELAIIFPRKEKRYANLKEACRIFKDLYYSVVHEIPDMVDRKCYNAYKFIYAHIEEGTFIAKEACNEIHNGSVYEDFAKTIVAGAKWSRVIRKFFQNIIVENGEIIDATRFLDFEKRYAELSDSLTDISIDKNIVISVNFLDFLTMSNGNSWSSCHYINSNGIFHEGTGDSYSGMYKQGCLSYALDNCSFLLYTLPGSIVIKDVYIVPKLSRLCFQYKSGVLVVGKDYPNNGEEVKDNHTNIVKTIISEIEGFDNDWYRSDRTETIEMYAKTARNSAHYRDYLTEHQAPYIYIRKNMSLIITDINDPLPSMTIGHEAYCLQCGMAIGEGDSEWLQCYSHRNSRICQVCGEYSEEPLQDINGVSVCGRCVFFCEYHKRYELLSDSECIAFNGKMIAVCKEALSKIKICEKCGNQFFEIDEECICENCYETNIRLVKINQDTPIEAGDYVVIKDHIDCRYGTNDDMRSLQGTIQRIEQHNGEGYHLSHKYWKWDRGCFAFKILYKNDTVGGRAIDKRIVITANGPIISD